MVPRIDVDGNTGAAASAQRRFFSGQHAVKELQHLLSAVSTNRAGSCRHMLDDFWSSASNIIMKSDYLPLRIEACSKTRVHACRHVNMQEAKKGHRSAMAGGHCAPD